MVAQLCSDFSCSKMGDLDFYFATLLQSGSSVVLLHAASHILHINSTDSDLLVRSCLTQSPIFAPG